MKMSLERCMMWMIVDVACVGVLAIVLHVVVGISHPALLVLPFIGFIVMFTLWGKGIDAIYKKD